MKPWLRAHLSCQDCSAELEVSSEEETRGDELITGTLACTECGLRWPVLGGIPFMLAEPGAHLASYREYVLASLVEVGQASAAALSIIDELSEGHEREAMRSSDDWTAAEGGAPLPEISKGGAALDHFSSLVAEEAKAGLHSKVLSMLGTHPLETVIEVGPGAGGLSALLAQRCDNLILVDHSLRSLLHAQEACESAPAQVTALLGDVGDLELASDCASAVVAANVVDLLDRPDEFLLAASRWLKPAGELILTTPEPSLGGTCDDTLRDLLESLEYEIVEVADGVPWIRMHSARYSQLYWLQAVRASILA